MTRFFGRHIAPEMLGLLLVELTLSFVLAYALLAPDLLSKGVYAGAAEHAVILAATIAFTSFLLGLYRPQLFFRTRNLLINTAFGGVAAFPAVWAVGMLLGIRSVTLVGPDPLWPIKILMIWIAALFGLRLCFMAAIRSKLFVRPVVVVGAVPMTAAVIRSGQAGFFEVVAPRVDPADPVALRKSGVRHAVTSAEMFDTMALASRDAYAVAGVQLEREPDFWERHLKRVDIDHLSADWFVSLDERPIGRAQAFINRAGDIGISLGLLIFTLPLMGLVALLVRWDSPGPILYKQERVGLGGHPFTLLKFRSMKTNAEARGPAWAQQGDPRVTRVGLLMRRTRIDELPQLVNVLRGQMSFIGPRPERPHFVEQLADVIPFYRERARVKPGLTGWAQVNYPYGASVEDARAKLSYDLFYVKNRSVLLDLLIMFATVRVILFQEGSR
ncbi:MAG: exopolysaccharide biosynthesis polyprenyl glycosylphosphotransferase [Janthinobacterium lividum]